MSIFTNLLLLALCLLAIPLLGEEKAPELTGKVIYPSSADYDKSRLVSNYYTSKDRFPAVIVYSEKAEDVQNAVKYARAHRLPIRIRSGGHNHEAYSTGNNAILIDVSKMKKVSVDKTKNPAIATIGPGLNNLELYKQLNEQNLTHVGGTCSEVGLSGLVLTGGMGPLLRRVGLTCDSLVGFDMVNAKGDLIHVTKDNEYKDLFWASCGGGGGNFGVITSLDLRVYPTETVTWFNIGWDWNQPVDKIISAWQDFFAIQDKRWFSHLDLWSKAFPSDKIKKAPIKVLGFFWGTPEEARKALEPLYQAGKPTFEVIETVGWDKAIANIEESTAVFLTEKPEYKSTGAFVKKTLPAEGIQTIAKALEDSKSPLFNVLLFSMGGATAEIPADATAYYYRDDLFFINYSIQWLNKEDDESQKAEIATLRAKLLPYTEGNYVGNPDPNIKDYMTSYYGKNADRLKCVKLKYDPDNVFNHEQSIPVGKPGDCK